jgi:imidazolonepropionase-like amidohydrolase
MSTSQTTFQDPSSTASRFAVVGERVFDSRAGAWGRGRAVLVEKGKIVGTADAAPSDWDTVLIKGTSLLPGLIDAHSHVLLQGTLDRYDLGWQMLEENRAHRIAAGVRAMSIALLHGFTTLRDLGTEGADYDDVGLRDAARERIVPGPRMLVCGPAIRLTGRYPFPGKPHALTFPVGVDSCTGAVACRETVRTQIAYGIDCVKVYVSGRVDSPKDENGYPDGPQVITEEELTAIVDEAHRHGLRVAAHAQTLSGTQLAVAAGVDSIEHGFAINPDIARQMAERGIFLVPTLLVSREAAERGWYVEEPVRRAHDRSFRNCVDAGVPIAFGTDVGGFEWTLVSQTEEFGLMTGLGLSTRRAIQAATSVAADLLELTGKIGVLDAGADADLIAVEGDPIEDIDALRRIALVVQGGRIVSRGGNDPQSLVLQEHTVTQTGSAG